MASDWCSVSLDRNKFRPFILNFPLPLAGEGEGEGKIEAHHPHLYPLPPKEGEDVVGGGSEQHDRKNYFRIRVNCSLSLWSLVTNHWSLP